MKPWEPETESINPTQHFDLHEGSNIDVTLNCLTQETESEENNVSDTRQNTAILGMFKNLINK